LYDVNADAFYDDLKSKMATVPLIVGHNCHFSAHQLQSSKKS